MNGKALWLRVKLVSLGIVIGALLCSVGAALLKVKPSAPSTTAQPAPELAGEKTTTLKCKPVIVYRDKVAEKLGVPAATGEHVVASAKLPGDSHPRTVSALYNEETGTTRLFDRRDKLPWLAFARNYEFGVAYLARDSQSGAVWRGDVVIELLQAKSLHAGLVGAADSGGGWYSGARVWYSTR